MRFFGRVVLGLTVLMAVAFGINDDAYAKARHAKADSDGSGVFKPPAPETKPIFVMAQALPIKPAAAVAEQRLKLPSLPAGPTGTAMGKENAPSDGERPYYSVRTIESLKLPLLFR